jgi:UDP-glucuronate decarboxylase
MNIIVFGGAGFIGTNLIKRLLDENHKVLSVDNLFTGQLENALLFNENENYSFIRGDITDESFMEVILDISLKKLFGEMPIIDEIYNLACPASPPKYQIDPFYTLYTSISVDGIAKMALKYNAKLLHTSTSEVYGDPEIHPQTEEYRGCVNTMGPRSCYDEGKRIAETFLYEHISKNKLKCKIVRIFNTYGPYMDPNDGRVVSNFICQALKNEDITVYGNENKTRSFQYIDDLIDGILLFMRNTSDDFCGPLNIGNPDEFTLKELYELVLDNIDTKSTVVYKDEMKDDPKKRRPDITLAKEKLNWEPKIKLNEGLLKTINYFKKII